MFNYRLSYWYLPWKIGNYLLSVSPEKNPDHASLISAQPPPCLQPRAVCGLCTATVLYYPFNKKKLCIWPMIWFFSGPFYAHPLSFTKIWSTVCLLSCWQRNKPTNGTENITSLVEIITCCQWNESLMMNTDLYCMTHFDKVKLNYQQCGWCFHIWKEKEY